jgi:hypothetical protein
VVNDLDINILALYGLLNVRFRVNRAQFCDVSFQSLADDDISEVPFPSMHGTEDAEEEEGEAFIMHPVLYSFLHAIALEALSALTVQDKPVDVFSTPPQLDGDLITLTLLPRSRWQTLLNLDVIQVCFIFCRLYPGAFNLTCFIATK